ncbi:hypothetical protein [Butyrivibrio sp. MC2013]|uniref:hypothetical protein n=1 Tax=Butyrivibrio sp. MC2013 TaxID=1280686 RepID=UPI00041F0ACF|nr:hypothetical protein [Butyrivibrio sp. MC2013]
MMKKLCILLMGIALSVALVTGCANAEGPKGAQPVAINAGEEESSAEDAAADEADEAKEEEQAEKAEQPEADSSEVAGSEEPDEETDETAGEEAEEGSGETIENPGYDKGIYCVRVNWSYFESDEGENDVYVELADGASTIDLSSVRKESQEITDTYYAKVNGQEEKIYSYCLSEDGYHLELFRDDINYSISWQTLSNMIETDCKAVITDAQGNTEVRDRNDYLIRSYTGAWYFGICTITNGRLGDYVAAGE